MQKAMRRALRPVRGAAVRTQRRLRNAADVLGLDRKAGPSAETRIFGTGDAQADVAIVICVWRRPERLAQTVELLARQRDVSIELHVWNNNRAASADVDAVLERAPFPATVTHSARNVGGFGRFYLSRTLAATYPFVVFIDDDVTFPETMARDFAAESVPGQISSFWAFRFVDADDFFARAAVQPGERVDYCGTGGTVVDTSVFLEPGLFLCPRRYWFVEDLWLSYYANRILGWDLRKSSVELQLDAEDGYDQYVHLKRRKSRFLRQLVRDGWSVSASPAGTGAAL